MPPTIRDEQEIDKKSIDLRLMARLLGFLRPYLPWAASTLLLILAASLARQAGPVLTKIAVDEHIVPGDLDGLGELVLLFAALLVAQFVIGYAQSWITSMVGQWTMRDVRLNIFTCLQCLPLKFFDRTPIGRLMARNTSDVDALNEFFTYGAVSLVTEAVTIASILFYIFCYLDVELGLLTCAFLPVAFAATLWLQNRTFQAFRQARTRFARFSADLQETLSGIEVVKLFNCEPRSARRFNEGTDEYLDARLVRTLYHSAYFPFMELCGAALIALVLWYGVGQVLREEIAWGVLVAMLQYVPRFFMPIRNLAEEYATVQVAMASSERIFELIDAEPEPDGGPVRRERVAGAIEFRHVWFAYEEEEWVLRDVSLLRRARSESRASRSYRLGQDYHHQLAVSLLRDSTRADSSRWDRHSRMECRSTAATLWLGAAGRLSLCRRHCQQHPPRRSQAVGHSRRPSGPLCQRRSLYRPPARHVPA